MRTLALVVAAGRGERLGHALPKQYLPLAGKPLLRHGVERLLAHPGIEGVQVVIGAGQEELCARALGGLKLPPPVLGGGTRQDSVRLGLESLAADAPERVLIHDAARALLSAGLLDRVLSALGGSEAVLPVLPVVDTLKEVRDGAARTGPDRAILARAQTPQGFHFAAILAAHRAAAGGSHTDDAAVAEAAGLRVATVMGEERNIKVTTAEDLALAQHWLGGGRRTRTGLGFDVHAFAPGRPMILCNVTIPHGCGLLGHSDADAALHAVTDAILGTIGAGDIGEHFPPGDPQWRDVDSAVFLRHAAGLLAQRGGRIENVDLVIICEAPKIGPHRPAMTARLAGLLDLQPDQVSIKATTSEGLGFTGRGEGLAAQAVVTVSLPDVP